MIYLAIPTAICVFFILNRKRKKKQTQQTQVLVKTPQKWLDILEENVLFYRGLKASQKLRFESDIQNFLKVVKITGVSVDVTIEDRLLVASSAVIPLFGFPEWTYTFLDEVILYPASFDRNFVIGSEKEIITGMVGNGPMEGKMILSKPALHAGFDIATDKRNVGIHEFVHLFDKEDGIIDGVPPGYDKRAYSLPWLDFIRLKTDEIHAKRSDIDSYATTNRQEFFAVASEYFFERPHLLKKKHPELFEELVAIFNQDTTTVIDQAHFVKAPPPGRNEPCICGSGKKYKKCCLVP